MCRRPFGEGTVDRNSTNRYMIAVKRIVLTSFMFVREYVVLPVNVKDRNLWIIKAPHDPSSLAL